MDEVLLLHLTVNFSLCSFQEVVPLNVGNVLGAADRTPIPKWEAAIYRALNQIQRGQTRGEVYVPPSPLLSSAAYKHDFDIQLPDKGFVGTNRPFSPRLDGVTGSCWEEYSSRSSVQGNF